MSSVDLDKTSKMLGDYMLKGWTLTDESCSVSTCNVPLMRLGTTRICVVHGDQDKKDEPSRASSLSSAETSSRASTPPTPLSAGPASPTFVLPEPSEETLRRRQQSDLAAQRIGTKMLQGYAMLAEECRNPECIGVPLIRPPRRDGTKDPHKECVICGNVYVESRDSRGFATLQLVEPSVPVETPKASKPVPIPTSERGTASAQTADAPLERKAKGKEVVREIRGGATILSNSTTSDTLVKVLASVDRGLETLSARLDHLSKVDITLMNPVLLGETAQQMTTLLETRRAAQQAISDDP